MRTHPVIRHPDPDDFRLLYPGLDKYTFNLDAVWIAVVDGDPAAGVILWDAGHSIVYGGDLMVREPYRHLGVGHALLAHVERTLKAAGKNLLLATTSQIEMAYWAKKKGAGVLGPQFLIAWRM